MSPQALHNVLSLYPAGYTPRTWDSLGTSAGFSGAHIARLETAQGSFCLRGWPVGSLPQERILGLHRLLSHVFRAGHLEVPVPVPAVNGETLVTWNSRYWQVEPWMPGQADFWSHPSPIRLRDAMSRLALFHQITRDYTDSGSARNWFYHADQTHSPAVLERLAYLNEWKHTKILRFREALATEIPSELREVGQEFAARFERVANLLGMKLEMLSRVKFPLQPCLRDLWHDHVLFTDEKVTGLIDASACRTDNVATDLSRLLGSLLRDDRAAWDLALREYEQHRPLQAHEKALLEGLDQSGVFLSGLAWMDRLVLQRERVSQLANVLMRLDLIRQRLTHMDETITEKHLWQIT